MAIIKGTTQLLGVIGYPVAHSFSPLMHNAAIAHLNQNASDPSGEADYVYLPFPIHPDNLERAIAGFAAFNLRGFNITIPHKQRIIALLDEVSEVAQAIGAVNTVWRTEASWYGTNTDVVGFLAPLKALNRDWANTPAMILGSGGAARAVVAACNQLGCPQIWVAGRSPDKLATFADSWSASPTVQSKLEMVAWDNLMTYLPSCGLVVNATPVGMHPHEGSSPLSAAEIAKLSAGVIAYDLIYTPRPTQFLQVASAAGLTAIDGLEMLVQQGAAALEIWLQRTAPVAVMRQTLLDYLAQRSRKPLRKRLHASN
jgi:shikimate dehydrogenase